MYSMKAFFDRYSYECVRLLLNQIAISMFGFALAMTAVKAESDTLLLWTSIASICFYLALIYGTAWKVGSGDRLSIQYGKIPYRPFRGLVLSLIANSINFLLAVLITLGFFCGAPILEDIPSAIALLSQGMYMGLLTVVKIGGTPLNDIWWVFFLLPLPAMLTSLVAYIAGAKDVHITKMGIPELPESDRPTRKELREQKELEKRGKK
ncbi:MAG: hypothetical protein IJD38_00980 [Clostridia bacterium]|nr:hypothetical protein [Clostridia bacterium]